METKTEIDYELIMCECMNAGNAAGRDKLAELQNAGSQFSVTDGNTGREVGRMLDLCGGAWITIADGRSPLIKGLKKIGELDGGSWVAKDRSWWLRKSYRFGYDLSIHSNVKRQEMSVNTAICEAAVRILVMNGFNVGVHTFVD